MKSNLTAIYIKDETTGLTVGYFDEYPEVTSQGDTIDEVETGLFKLLPMALDVRKDININKSGMDSLTTRSYSL